MLHAARRKPAKKPAPKLPRLALTAWREVGLPALADEDRAIAAVADAAHRLAERLGRSRIRGNARKKP